MEANSKTDQSRFFIRASTHRAHFMPPIAHNFQPCIFYSFWNHFSLACNLILWNEKIVLIQQSVHHCQLQRIRASSFQAVIWHVLQHPGLSMVSSGTVIRLHLDWVSMGFDGFWWVLVGSGGFWWGSMGFNGFWWVLVGSGGFWRVLVGFGGFWWVLVGFEGCGIVSFYKNALLPLKCY